MGFKSWIKKLFGREETPPAVNNATPCVCMQQGGYWYCFRQVGGGPLEVCPNSGQYLTREECENATHGQCP